MGEFLRQNGLLVLKNLHIQKIIRNFARKIVWYEK